MSKDLMVIIIDMLAGTKNLNPNEREDVINAVIDILDKEAKRDD